MQKRYIYFIVLAVIGFIGIAWLYSNNAPQKPVRIAINPFPSYEFLYLAEQKGFLKEEGLNIQLKPFSSLEDVRLAFERDQVDGICATAIELLQAYANRKKTGQIVILTDYSNGADAIVARNPIRTIKDLKGKKVAIEPKSVNLLILTLALQKYGMSLQDVQIQNIANLDIPDALRQQKVDAAVTYPPMYFDALKIEGVTKIFDSSSLPGEILDIIAVTPDTTTNNPDFVPALRRAWKKAHFYWNNHPAEAEALMAQREGISVKDFHDAIQGIRILSIEDQEALFKNGKVKTVLKNTRDVLKNANDLNSEISEVDQFIYQP